MNTSLVLFKANNPAIKIVDETEHINIDNLWDDDTFMCRFKNDIDITSLNDVILPVELSAIYHKSEKSLEYIYGTIPTNDRVIGRNFTFHYLGKEFLAEFTDPSETLKLIASGFRELKPNDVTEYRNLRGFRDFYLTEKPPFLEKFFKDKIPCVFKVRGDFDDKIDFSQFSKNLNFYLTFNDRQSPFILIFEKREHEKYIKPCYSASKAFPESIIVRTIDPVLIDLFEVARKTANIRLKFLFYYQVLEYCSYYHLNETVKKRLTNIIKRPDLLNNALEYGRLITDEFKDYFKNNDDSAKLNKLLNDYLSVDDISMEIVSNSDFFLKDIKFDGGFIIEPLISDIKEVNSQNKGLLTKIKTNIENIRNVLVHIRESRENKVILPTNKNSNLLIPYLYLIQRIAEYIAIQYE